MAKSAHKIIVTIQKVKETALNIENNEAGTLRLGVSNFFTDYMLPQLLKLFKEQYQNIEFKVTTGISSDIAHLIYDKAVHISIVKGDYSWKDQKHLLFEETICIASKDKIDIRNLPKLTRIDYHTDSLLKSSIDNWWYEYFTQPPLVNIEVDKVDTCKKMVVNRLGYAILPSMILNDTNDIHKIILKTTDGKPIVRKTWMLYHEESLELNIVKVFVEFVKSLDLETLI